MTLRLSKLNNARGFGFGLPHLHFGSFAELASSYPDDERELGKPRSGGERQTAATGRASGWRRGGDKRPCGRTTILDRVARDQTANDEQIWDSKRLTGSAG